MARASSSVSTGMSLSRGDLAQRVEEFEIGRAHDATTPPVRLAPRVPFVCSTVVFRLASSLPLARCAFFVFLGSAVRRPPACAPARGAPGAERRSAPVARPGRGRAPLEDGPGPLDVVVGEPPRAVGDGVALEDDAVVVGGDQPARDAPFPLAAGQGPHRHHLAHRPGEVARGAQGALHPGARHLEGVAPAGEGVVGVERGRQGPGRRRRWPPGRRRRAGRPRRAPSPCAVPRRPPRDREGRGWTRAGR